MKTVKRTMTRFALAAIALGGLSVTLAAMPVEPPSLGAFRWVQSLGEAERVFYLRDSVLPTLPPEHRNALLASIPRGQARADFWRSAFTSYRDRRDLSPNQVSALNRAVDHASALDGQRQSANAYNVLIADLQETFGSDGANKLLYRSETSIRGGNQLPTLERIAHEWRRLRTTLAATFRGASFRVPDCNCNTVAECGPATEWECSDSVSCSEVNNCPGGNCADYCIPKGLPQS